MTVADLIEILQDMDPQAQVRLAQQPRWAFEYSIGEVAQTEPPRIITRAEFEAMDEDTQQDAMNDADEGRAVLMDEGEPADSFEHEPVVYIGEGSQLQYLPGNAAAALGWA